MGFLPDRRHLCPRLHLPLGLVKEFPRNDGFVHIGHHNPVLLGARLPLLAPVGGCVLPSLHHAPHIHLILQDVPQVALTPEPLSHKLAVPGRVVPAEPVVLRRGQDASLFKTVQMLRDPIPAALISKIRRMTRSSLLVDNQPVLVLWVPEIPVGVEGRPDTRPAWL